METYCYKLRFPYSLHIGLSGIGLEQTDEILHSDTIFSAIFSKWNLLYDNNVEEVINKPPFIISSAFPYKKDSFFFPRPMIRIINESEEDLKYGKKLKKVKFVSKKIFERLINGESVKFNENNTLQDGLFWIEGESENLSGDGNIVYRKREVPRVIIDRITNQSEIFYFNEIVFSEDSGLFFLVKFLDDSKKKEFDAILRLLGDEGIGGDKSSGKGHFFIASIEVFKINEPQNAEFFTTLALYHPQKDEFSNGILKNSFYEIITRKGWVHSISGTSLRRKNVRMFREGSIFKDIYKTQYGDIIKLMNKNLDLGLNHNIYRNGIAFKISVKLRGNNGKTNI